MIELEGSEGRGIKNREKTKGGKQLHAYIPVHSKEGEDKRGERGWGVGKRKESREERRGAFRCLPVHSREGKNDRGGRGQRITRREKTRGRGAFRCLPVHSQEGENYRGGRGGGWGRGP